MKRFLHSWVINTLAVLVAVYLLRPRIDYASPLDLFVASLLLGILNAVLRPVLMLLTFPILIVTLGLFRFVINALLLLLVGYLLRSYFWVHGFWAAFWGALIISLVSSILNVLTGAGRLRVSRRVSRRRPPGPPDDGGGPVIDV
ncbi:MAG: phage holin family protein [Limisphaerales bacterium]